jgi:hypothetical protein
VRADAVDVVVLLHPLGSPVAGQGHLLGGDLLLGTRDGDEVRGATALVDNLAGDAVFVETEMAPRLAVGRIEDWVLNDRWRQSGPPLLDA